MNDLVDGCRVEGKVILDGEDIYDKRVDTTLLRKKVGMVFQQPNPFPMSIYDNIAYGPRLHGIKNKKELDEIVERSLQGAAIFGAGLLVGLVNIAASIYQAKVCANGIAAIGNGHDVMGKTLILAAFPELYAILTVAATYLIATLDGVNLF